MSRLELVRWGRLPYAEAHARMVEALDARLQGAAPDRLFLCEHDPVYTLGRARGAASHVFAPGDTPVLAVERGGDVTHHGPGQLVGYPVVLLPEHRRDLHAWMRFIEEVLILALARFGVAAGRDPRNTGVWVRGRKIGAIGIACRRWVSWHGFSLNVSIDRAGFERIAPCGMDSALVTRLWDELAPAAGSGGGVRSPAVELVEVEEQISRIFAEEWDRWSEAPGEVLP